MKIQEGKKQIFTATNQLLEEGLIMGSWGNISCRVDEDDSSYPNQGSFIITTAGRQDFVDRTEDDVIEVGLEDFSYDKDSNLKPSMEYRIHAAVYRARPDVKFVLHTHQTNAAAVSAMSMDVIKFDKEYPGIGSFVLCSPYALIGSRRLLGNVAKTMVQSDSKAIIMKNHGVLCFGDSFEEAIQVAKSLEEACGKYLVSLGMTPCDISGWNLDEYNMSPSMEKYISARNSLPAHLTTFAQVIGSDIPVIEDWEEDKLAAAEKAGSPVLVKGKGLYCYGDNKELVAQIVEQNCMAALAGIGTKPLDALRCRLLHEQFRLKK